MKYDKKEKGLQICLNKEELPFDEYYIGSDNYYRRINDINPKKTKGSSYALMGWFEDKRSTTLFDGELYLAVCREQGQKTINFLFTLENGKPVLIDKNKRKTKAVEPMWNKIENFLNKKPQVSLQTLFNAIYKLNPSLHRLEEFSVALHSYAMGYEFDSDYTLPKTNEERVQKTMQELQKEIEEIGGK